MISKIEGPNTSEILMEALGPNLRKLLKRIRVLHHLGFIHNDLKLDNILVGHKDPH